VHHHVCSRMLTYAHVCSRMRLEEQRSALLTYAHVCSRMLTYAHVCAWRSSGARCIFS
jgi:hypothetical protein